MHTKPDESLTRAVHLAETGAPCSCGENCSHYLKFDHYLLHDVVSRFLRGPLMYFSAQTKSYEDNSWLHLSRRVASSRQKSRREKTGCPRGLVSLPAFHCENTPKLDCGSSRPDLSP